MKNVKFRGIRRKKTNSAVNSADQNPRKTKFRGSARNSAARGKLWALLIYDYNLSIFLVQHAYTSIVCHMITSSLTRVKTTYIENSLAYWILCNDVVSFVPLGRALGFHVSILSCFPPYSL